VLVGLSVVLGILFNHYRIGGLRSHIDACFDDADKRFNDVDKSFDDLKDFIRSEVRRLEDL